MHYIIFAIVYISTFQYSTCQQCPAIYLRYSKDHSYCKPRNPNCPIYKAGVTPKVQNQILKLHNEYRSHVATGYEILAGGMPTASNMLQMVWDTELAAIAQKRAEQCIYDHDCSNCRKVENFNVGQNIAYLERLCCGIKLEKKPDWPKVIKMFYDEVAIFDKKLVNSFVYAPEKVYGHFTQIIWAKTWRIGCGFVAFRKETGYRQLYVCNYGPGGNIENLPVYKIGNPCSSCPINSCCGNSCKKPSYQGLCKMNKKNEAPLYPKVNNFIFYCDFANSIGDCNASVNGVNKWKFIQTLGGSFAEIVLSGGETSTMVFKKTIRPKDNFCLIIMYKTGPTIDGLKISNTAAITLEMPNASSVTRNLPNAQKFLRYSLSLHWSYDTKIHVTFSVPRGVPDQFLNIQTISVKSGECH